MRALAALGAEPLKLQRIVQTIRPEIQPDQAMDFMRHVYATDRWFTHAEELLGTIWLEQNRYDRARSQFNHVLTVGGSAKKASAICARR